MPDEDQAALIDDFLASPYGQRYVDSKPHLQLLDSLLWFGTGYGTCDPLRWSPVNVEVLLVDWFPRKVMAPVAELTLLPELLRSFIGYAHERRGIRAHNRAETLVSVGRWEHEYQELIRTDRPQGAEALARMLLTDDGLEAMMIEGLVDAVGDADTLDQLDDVVLPDEPFDASGVPDDILPKILEMVALCDENADARLDVEHRTANRRLIRLLALADPGHVRGCVRLGSGAPVPSDPGSAGPRADSRADPAGPGRPARERGAGGHHRRARPTADVDRLLATRDSGGHPQARRSGFSSR